MIWILFMIQKYLIKKRLVVERMLLQQVKKEMYH